MGRRDRYYLWHNWTLVYTDLKMNFCYRWRKIISITKLQLRSPLHRFAFIPYFYQIWRQICCLEKLVSKLFLRGFSSSSLLFWSFLMRVMEKFFGELKVFLCSPDAVNSKSNQCHLHKCHLKRGFFCGRIRLWALDTVCPNARQIQMWTK